ncbi:MAG: hypothetical protein JWO77_450 [Ilumatobacteraceae bacterium]|nr:hypothetical protein [Ilumatobacteraceae bacterium]
MDHASPTTGAAVWRVDRPVRSAKGDEIRAVVDGEEVWVRAPGHRLTDVPEAWATALAIPAARTGSAIDLPRSLDPVWEAGAQANIAQMASWWGGASSADLRTPPPSRWSRAVGYLSRGPNPARGRALCFTGGVDSFFSLLAGDHRPTHLLFVHGYDIPLDDTDRRAAASRSIQAVATARGLVALEVETNLRHHHCFAQASWEHTHGAALVGIALLLRAEVGTLVIPPSYATSRLIPWGSHPELDERWSVPGVLAVEHGDALPFRRERLRAVADDPLVHEHLRVCWAHLQPGTNCGRCEKCVRTLVDLEYLGRRRDVTTFPSEPDLPELIDGLSHLPASIVPMWRDLRNLPLPPDVVAALDRVLDRSPA